MSAVRIESGPLPPQVAKAADGPRKRRKRAPVAGAADDCFTCSGRSAKCDRRRPYCSTCLESGQDCAGYKTQLTWGVGVASRGKLRGLSLPVAGTSKLAESSSSSKKKRTISPSKVEAVRVPGRNNASLPLSPESATGTTFGAQRPTSLADPAVFQPIQLHQTNHRHQMGGPVPSTGQPDLLPSPVSSHVESSPIAINWPNGSAILAQNIYTSSLNSPAMYSTHSRGSNYLDYMPQSHHEGHHVMNPHSAVVDTLNRVQLADTFPSHSSHQESFSPAASALPYTSHDNYVSVFPEEEVEEISRNESSCPASEAYSLSSSPLMMSTSITWAPLSGSATVGKTPRMQYLIQYYAEVIAPVIVAFDSPTNPFRDRILNLASKSDSLQHALSALAASNLRQRKESGALSTGKTLPARRSSAAHLSLTSTTTYDVPIIPARDQRREEVYHKFHAVQSLNAALADPYLLKDDAVLATLLVLCLFHICDSGIARFQTQFAGVKKLLNLRRAESGEDDSSTRWMTRIFTWFDAMAATVNEREGQFGGQILESSVSSDEEWSYETLAGVDGRLFRTMSQLGRLNILSQGRHVEATTTLISRPLPFMGSSSSVANQDFNTFDGNGWMRIIDDENFFNMKTAPTPQFAAGQGQHNSAFSPFHGISNGPANQEQFWREWREVRQQLQTWNLNNSRYETSRHAKGPHLSEEQCLDIDNISNAFRYSALLYTERLGHPTLPSNHERIQYWVRRSLHHIKKVRSDVYLLWPLFITGSECVHEEGRNIIRERCEDIQKDSGFVNNASCLALLEKVWKVVPVVAADTRSGTGPAQQQIHDQGLKYEDSLGNPLGTFPSHDIVNGFRFRDVMQAENNEGEWIVV